MMNFNLYIYLLIIYFPLNLIIDQITIILKISVKCNLYRFVLYLLFIIITGHSQADMWRIRKAISEASSLEEVEQLSKLLEAGQIPNKDQNKKSVPLNGGK
jgi:hypothetical protein